MDARKDIYYNKKILKSLIFFRNKVNLFAPQIYQSNQNIDI